MQCYDAGGAGLRLDEARRRARLDARRRLADRLGLRDRDLSDPCRRCGGARRLMADGDVRVQTAAHEIGTGAYTVIGQIGGRAARRAACRRHGRSSATAAAAGAGCGRLEHHRERLLGRAEGLRRDPRQAVPRGGGRQRRAAGRPQRLPSLTLKDGTSSRRTARAERWKTRSGGSASARSRNMPSSCRRASKPDAIEKLYAGQEPR